MKGILWYFQTEGQREILLFEQAGCSICVHKMQKYLYMHVMVCCHSYCHASGSSPPSFLLMKYHLIWHWWGFTVEMPWVFKWNMYLSMLSCYFAFSQNLYLLYGIINIQHTSSFLFFFSLANQSSKSQEAQSLPATFWWEELLSTK